jgi:hypothetical protein
MLGLAANLRLLGKYSSAHGLDAALRDAMRTAVNTYGRDAVIARASSQETAAHMRQTLGAAGVVSPEGTIERRIYEQQLDVVLEEGAALKTLATSATVLEGAYAEWINRRPSGGGQIIRVQNWDQLARCASLNQQCNYYGSLTNYWCAMAMLVPPVAALCAANGLSAAGYCYAAHHYGC